MDSLRSVFVTYDFVGHHRWPDAPTDVGYLAGSHRHVFGVRVEVSVDGDNREIEYHTLKRQLLNAQRMRFNLIENTNEADLGAKSCEMVAEIILEDVMSLYPERLFYRVTVTEDGENGSTVSTVAE